MVTAQLERCEECGLVIPAAVYDAQTALYGYRYGGFAGRDLARRIAEALERECPFSDEEIAIDAIKAWLEVDDFATLVAAVRHEIEACGNG